MSYSRVSFVNYVTWRTWAEGGIPGSLKLNGCNSAYVVADVADTDDDDEDEKEGDDVLVELLPCVRWSKNDLRLLRLDTVWR